MLPQLFKLCMGQLQHIQISLARLTNLTPQTTIFTVIDFLLAQAANKLGNAREKFVFRLLFRSIISILLTSNSVNYIRFCSGCSIHSYLYKRLKQQSVICKRSQSVLRYYGKNFTVIINFKKLHGELNFHVTGPIIHVTARIDGLSSPFCWVGNIIDCIRNM